ncbi:hypothetical protein Xph01_14640 [Micromonospora phaseoli]|nr:hypothetical protein Xph01_14640 [Micromonospora phaseoli]
MPGPDNHHVNPPRHLTRHITRHPRTLTPRTPTPIPLGFWGRCHLAFMGEWVLSMGAGV